MSYENKGSPDRSIIGMLITFTGLIEKIFGKYTEFIILDSEIENNKNILRTIYGITDTDYIFPKIIDYKKFSKTLNTVFRFAPYNNNEDNGK